MELQALAERVEELHKKVDTLTNMMSDLLEQIDDRRSDNLTKRRQVEAQIARSRDMLMSMPGVKNNPAAQQMVAGMFGIVNPGETVQSGETAKSGCGGCDK